MQAPYIYLVLAGFFCGVFGATFGVGSGILLTPLLVLGLGLSQHVAQGTCLAVMIPMALVSLISYRFIAGVKLESQIIMLLGIGAVIGAVAGSLLVGSISGGALQRMFAVVTILLGIRMLAEPGWAAMPMSQTRTQRSLPPLIQELDACMF